jgi:hypothetical protein
VSTVEWALNCSNIERNTDAFVDIEAKWMAEIPFTFEFALAANDRENEKA